MASSLCPHDQAQDTFKWGHEQPWKKMRSPRLTFRALSLLISCLHCPWPALHQIRICLFVLVEESPPIKHALGCFKSALFLCLQALHALVREEPDLNKGHEQTPMLSDGEYATSCGGTVGLPLLLFLLHPSKAVALLCCNFTSGSHPSIGRHTCTCIVRLHMDDILACTPVDEEI